MAIREGRWDCPQCGNKRNRGADVKCAACGKVRGTDVQFYLPDEASEVEDAAALDRAQAGADWICEFCGATTPSGQRMCRSCGAQRTETRREQRDLRDEAPPPPAPPKKKRGWVKFALAGLALLGAGMFVCRSSERQMTVEKVAWERSVAVERFTTVVEEAWRDELPSGARLLSSERKFHHNDKIRTGTRTVTKTVEEEVQTGTRKVKVGKRDLGNGYFEDLYEDKPIYEKRERRVTEDEPVYRDDPVYKDWCRYEIDKWVVDRVERAAGDDGSPRWPEPALGGAKLRAGKKSSAYRVVFRDADKKEWQWEPPEEVWKGLAPGGSYRVVTRLGKVQGLAK